MEKEDKNDKEANVQLLQCRHGSPFGRQRSLKKGKTREREGEGHVQLIQRQHGAPFRRQSFERPSQAPCTRDKWIRESVERKTRTLRTYMNNKKKKEKRTSIYIMHAREYGGKKKKE